MTQAIKNFTEICPICTPETRREPGITELAGFVCDDHVGTWKASRCTKCGRGIFIHKSVKSALCIECEKAR